MTFAWINRDLWKIIFSLNFKIIVRTAPFLRTFLKMKCIDITVFCALLVAIHSEGNYSSLFQLLDRLRFKIFKIIIYQKSSMVIYWVNCSIWYRIFPLFFNLFINKYFLKYLKNVNPEKAKLLFLYKKPYFIELFSKLSQAWKSTLTCINSPIFPYLKIGLSKAWTRIYWYRKN